MSLVLVSGLVSTELAPLEINLAISSGSALPVTPNTTTALRTSIYICIRGEEAGHYQ